MQLLSKCWPFEQVLLDCQSILYCIFSNKVNHSSIVGYKRQLNLQTFFFNSFYECFSEQRYIKRWIAPTQIEATKRKKAVAENPLSKPAPPRNAFAEWNRNCELYAFNQRLTERFDDKLLDQAFTTRPYVIAEEMKCQELGVAPQVDLKDNRELIEEGRGLTSKIIIKYLGVALPKVPQECLQ